VKTKCVIIAAYLIIFSSIVATAQSDTAFWNNKMLKIANSGGGQGFIRLKEDTKFTPNEFFITNKEAFRLSDNDEMILLRTKSDDLGYSHHLYQQKHNGVKIEGAEYILHEFNGRISTANGKLLINIEKQTNPSISKEVALQNALGVVNASKYAWEVKNPNGNYFSSYPEGELLFTKKHDSLPFDQNSFVLAYKFDIFSIEPYTRNYIYINAQTGEFIKKQTRIINDCDCCNGTAQTLYNGQQTIVTHHRWLANDYILKDNCRGDGIHTFLSGSNVDDGDNQWSLLEERPATSAHWATEMTYDFYYNVFGRNSFDNNGAEMVVNTNDDSNGQDNAFWNGSDFHYGSGGGGSANNALVSLDVVGHEYTHAVTENEANLTYSYESGALNESFSDIFGTMVEFYVEGNNGNYFLGEDFWIEDGRLRDMTNPNIKDQPDTYLGTFWHTTATDNGGVHTNNGVQNYWFFLLSEGGSGINDNGQSFNVQGIGRDKAASIAYRNLTVYLTSSSDYSDAKNGSIWAAMDLYGNCSNEVLQTVRAWDAVGVFSAGGFDFNIVVNCAILQIFHVGLPQFIQAQPVTFRAINDLSANCAISPNGQPVTFVAGNSIQLLPGFKSGNNFHAYIDPCLAGIQLKSISANNENTTGIVIDNNINDTIKNTSTYDFIENENTMIFQVYPNPNNGIFNIVVQTTNKTDLIIELMNIQGQIIYRNNVKGVYIYKDQVNVSDFAKGIYFLRINTVDKVEIRKIVIQ